MDRVIIDVREIAEYANGHVEGAVHIPLSVLMDTEDVAELRSLPKDTPIILYCRSGRRADEAMRILRSVGFMNLTNGIDKENVEAKYLNE